MPRGSSGACPPPVWAPLGLGAGLPVGQRQKAVGSPQGSRRKGSPAPLSPAGTVPTASEPRSSRLSTPFLSSASSNSTADSYLPGVYSAGGGEGAVTPASVNGLV